MKIPFECFKFKICTPSQLDDIIEIQDEVSSELGKSDILRINTTDMLMDCLNPPHITVGAWYGDTLAGFAVLYCPQSAEEELAPNLDNIDLSNVNAANYKLCIVRSEYRGNSLQYYLELELERFAKDKGINMLCATVSPKNKYSLDNVSKLGYIYNKTLTKYGFERNLYYKFI